MASGTYIIRDNVGLSTYTHDNMPNINGTISIVKYGRIVYVSGEFTTLIQIPAFTTIIDTPSPVSVVDVLAFDGNGNIVAPLYINTSNKLASRKVIPANTLLYFSTMYIEA